MHGKRRDDIRKMMTSSFGNVKTLNKTAVMGILNRETLQKEILSHVAHGSKIYTDEATIYRSIPKDYIHDFVNHMERYVKGRVHTNGLENFWGLLKRGLGGTYVAVEPFHLARYDEQSFRCNNRIDGSGKKLKDAERFELALSQIAGKRLTFAEVTGKVEETAAN
jgi:hypothetical protein